MKRILILAGIFLIVHSLFAQSPNKRSGLQAMHRQVVSGLLQQQSAASDPNMRTTSGITLQRVIAQSRRDNSFNTLVDSVDLKYSLQRGSTYDYNTMIYPYNYTYSQSPMFNNDQGSLIRPEVLCDTYSHWEVDPNTLIYGYYETGYSTYNAANNQVGYMYLNADSTRFASSGFRDPNMVFINRFNSSNNIDSAYSFNWQAGVADSAFKQFFSYTSGKLTKDSTYELHLGVWRLASKSLYTYNVANDLIQIDNYANDTDTSFTQPLVELIKYVNVYDASHRLLSTASSYFDQDSLLPYINDTFAYSGTSVFHNSWREYQMDPINRYWAPMFNMTKTVNSLSLPDTINIRGFDSILNAWVPQTLEVTHYNSYHNPDTLKEYDYNFTSFPTTPSFTTIYYYGTYITAAVNNVSVVSQGAKIFPNPATGSIAVTQLDVPVNSLITISVVNVSGQIVAMQGVRWQSIVELPVNELLAGVYWLYVNDASGNLVCRQAFVKQ